MHNVSVVLVETHNTGNMGSVSRAMKNFGCTRLLLVNPKASHKTITARKFAMHGSDVLRNAKKISWQDVLKHDVVVSTTARLSNDYNIPRSPLTPRKAAEKLAAVKKRSIALVFGPEDAGLPTSYILDSDFIITIPTAQYAALNLAQAVTVILYELHTIKPKEFFTPVSAAEKVELQRLIHEQIDTLPFATKEKRETQRRVWNRVIGKALLTRREAFALLGFFRKLRR
jgi:tRNA/rRNA methyltransferase